MLRFIDQPQRYPEVENAQKRKQNFDEIYAQFDPARASEQASRCSQCGIPFCQVHCPLNNNIPDWLKLTAEGRIHEAYKLAASTNTFPEICGRICPQDRLCEGNCVIEKGFGAVTIGSVEKYITDTAFEEGWVEPIRPQLPESGLSVGIIGSGPAGLAAAHQLRLAGHAVTVYERSDRAGGLLMYGIPNFKLDKSVVQRRLDWLSEGGVTWQLNAAIGENIDFQELRRAHDAVLIATGVYQAKELQCPNASLEHIIPAMDYLTASNQAGLNAELSPSMNAEGKHVVVLGGGDTAMDCVRTAVRQHAASVTCLYRRDRANMPGSAREVKHAEDEGVVFEWLAMPVGFTGDHRVSAVLAQRMRLVPSEHGKRQDIVPIEGEQFTVKADMVIKALGFDAEPLPGMFGAAELEIRRDGTLAVDPISFETSLPGVYAAGDIVRGASLVVWAIRDGRDAAAAMHQALIRKTKAVA